MLHEDNGFEGIGRSFRTCRLFLRALPEWDLLYSQSVSLLHNAFVVPLPNQEPGNA